MSDGELDEGSNWEAFLSAAHNNLNNLVAIVDEIGFKVLKIQRYCYFRTFINKVETFNWDVKSIDGHNHIELKDAFEKLSSDKPNLIIANTIKERVSFMENKVIWHYKSPSKRNIKG